MTWFFCLPAYYRCDLLSEWVEPSDLGHLDAATSNGNLRVPLMESVKYGMNLPFSDPIQSSDSRYTAFLSWSKLRHIQLLSLCLSKTSSSTLSAHPALGILQLDRERIKQLDIEVYDENIIAQLIAVTAAGKISPTTSSDVCNQQNSNSNNNIDSENRQSRFFPSFQTLHLLDKGGAMRKSRSNSNFVTEADISHSARVLQAELETKKSIQSLLSSRFVREQCKQLKIQHNLLNAQVQHILWECLALQSLQLRISHEEAGDLFGFSQRLQQQQETQLPFPAITAAQQTTTTNNNNDATSTAHTAAVAGMHNYPDMESRNSCHHESIIRCNHLTELRIICGDHGLLKLDRCDWVAPLLAARGRELDLVFSQGDTSANDDQQLRIAHTLFKHCRSIKRYQLCENSCSDTLTDSGIKAFLAVCGHKIETLSISRWSGDQQGITYATLRHIAKFCVNLRLLEVHGIAIQGEKRPATIVRALVQGLQSLRSLRFENCSIREDEAAAVLKESREHFLRHGLDASLVIV